MCWPSTVWKWLRASDCHQPNALQGLYIPGKKGIGDDLTRKLLSRGRRKMRQNRQRRGNLGADDHRNVYSW